MKHFSNLEKQAAINLFHAAQNACDSFRGDTEAFKECLRAAVAETSVPDKVNEFTVDDLVNKGADFFKVSKEVSDVLKILSSQTMIKKHSSS